MCITCYNTTAASLQIVYVSLRLWKATKIRINAAVITIFHLKWVLFAGILKVNSVINNLKEYS